MNVLYVCSLTGGGPVTHLLDLVPCVARLGARVDVVCATDDLANEFHRRGVSARALQLKSQADVAGALRLNRQLRQATIVHTHDRRAGLLIRPQAALTGATCVHTLHGVPERLFESVVPLDTRLPASDDAALGERVRLRAEAVLSRIGTTVVPSHALARYLSARGFSSERLRVVPNAVSVHRDAPNPRSETLVLGTAAILERRKAIDVLLHACARISTKARLEIFGDGSLRRELETLARDLGVAARFHGHVPDAGARLAEIDVFVLPSRAENLPMSILEAMSWALPVVATRVGGIPEAVLDGETGFLVEPDDPDGLAHAIEKLGRDERLRIAFGRAGAARARREFDSDKIAKRMVCLYEELAGARPA